MSSYAIGIVFGGTLISAFGALSTYTLEKKDPTIKTVARDFIIGSIMFLFIMYLLPESSNYVITYLLALSPTSLPSLGSTFGASSELLDELEIQVGVPKF